MKKTEKKSCYWAMIIIAIISILLFSMPNGTITIGNDREIVKIHLQDTPEQPQRATQDTQEGGVYENIY